MYSREDLKKTAEELKEKIETTEITEEVFAEIEKDLKQVGEKQGLVVQQVSSLVGQANDLCLLHKEIQGTVNMLYSQLKAKKLADEGIDLSKESNWYKYDSHISHALIYGDFLKVELEKTMV